MDIQNQEEIEKERVQRCIDKVTGFNEFLTNNILYEIRNTQPFVFSMIVGFAKDLKAEESNETAAMIFIIWEYFKSLKNNEYRTISEPQFSEVMNNNLALMHHIEEHGEQNEIFESVQQKFKSKALFTGITNLLNSQSALIDMETEPKGIVVIGMKSLIECFEMNAKNKGTSKLKGLLKWWK